jgi:RNA polymerase sigma-70 factor (ECF subfamily)
MTARTNEFDVGAICYATETQPLQTDMSAAALEADYGRDRIAVFEAITLPNLRALHSKARQLLKDPSAADDVVQETCLRAWQIFDRFAPGTNGHAWLLAILMNVVKHEYRRRGRWRTDPRSQEILENFAAPSSKNTGALTDQQLLGAIEGMPLHFRQVLLLADVAEFRYHEIAEALRIPLGTVMSRLSRARAHLRCQLTGFSSLAV